MARIELAAPGCRWIPWSMPTIAAPLRKAFSALFPHSRLNKFMARSRYLSHKTAVDRYIAEGDAEFEKLQQGSRQGHSDWYERLRRAREEVLTSQS